MLKRLNDIYSHSLFSYLKSLFFYLNNAVLK